MNKNAWDLPLYDKYIKFSIYDYNGTVRKKISNRKTIIITEMEEISKKVPTASRIQHALRLLKLRGAIEGQDYCITRDIKIVPFLHLYTIKNRFLSFYEDNVCN